MVELLIVPIFSWLWRVAGRGGFPNSLWLRRIVVPYMIWLATGNWIGALVIAFATCLPITLKGDHLKDNHLWLWVLGAIYGLGVALLFHDWTHSLAAGIFTATLFSCGFILVDFSMDKYAEDFWGLFEYCFGFWIGLAVLLSTYVT